MLRPKKFAGRAGSLARDLDGEKPLETIPLARRIASATVEPCEQR
jgi:hypothetical protein